jgi:8-oxo-dGTP pyrophosphatase MutT (NUDIX family)
MNDKWKRLSQKDLYKGRVHIIDFEAELPDGTTTHYEVDHNEFGAAACLIKIGDNKVVLAYEYRFPIDKWIYDLPGGGRDAGETFEEAARRECREEVGVDPHKLIHLAEFCPNPARSDHSINLFFSSSYDEVDKVDEDSSEIVHKKVITFQQVEEWISKGEIVDPSFLIAWYTARQKGLL